MLPTSRAVLQSALQMIMLLFPENPILSVNPDWMILDKRMTEIMTEQSSLTKGIKINRMANTHWFIRNLYALLPAWAGAQEVGGACGE